MQRGGLVTKLIVDIDDDSVALRRSHHRKWPFSIYTDGGSLKSAVRVRCDPGNVKIVGDGRCFCEKDECKKQRW